MSTKRKLPAKFAAPNVKAKMATRTPSKQIQAEARAVVGHGALDQDSPSAQLAETATIEISSDEASEDDDLSEDEENFHANGDTSMADADDAEEGEKAAEPSFGDLVLATSAEPINVKEAFAASGEQKRDKKALSVPSGASLGVVLTQALKTNDLALLESCLQTSDLATIRATIQRLDAPLASTLLSLLAARLARRPGRAGSLMVWIQWTLVTHGGYLATQPSLIAKMAELNRIVEDRARGLSGLLALKGKLDLLDAQMMLRRSVRDARGREDEEEEDDEDVIYVEGEEEEELSDSEDDETVPGAKTNGTSHKAAKAARNIKSRFEDSEGSESEDMPDTFEGAMDVDSEEDSDDDEEGMIDDEAESTDDDEGDSEEEVDFEEVDEDIEDSEEDGATVGGQTPGRTPKGKGRRG